MQHVFLLFAALVLISCQESNPDTNRPLSADRDTLTQPQNDLPADSVLNRSFVAANGEKFLRFELRVPLSLEETWKLFATEAGMKTWMAPVVKLDLRIGGIAQTNYDTTAKIGDKGTIPLGIIHYLPQELITYKVTLNEVFPEKCRAEDKNLQEIVQMEAIGKNQTKIISTMIGWGEGKEWNNTYSFFEKGNQWTYEQLGKQLTAQSSK